MAGTRTTSVRSYRFYTRSDPALTTNFADCQLTFIDKDDNRTNFLSQGVIIANDDNASEIQFSFDGTTVEGDLLPQESMNFFTFRHKVIYLRGAAGGEPYRLWSW